MMDKGKKGVSIIIPCLNEAEHLMNNLPVLISRMSEFDHGYEIILMDNGSSDGSPMVAQRWGVRTEIVKDCNISVLRNKGAKIATYSTLAFLDADIEITKKWIEALNEFVGRKMYEKRIITGAPCLRPPNSSLLERHWFNGSEFRDTHINSGNLIVGREVFLSLRGFPEHMETGEDWEFCQRAIKANVKLKIDTEFEVYHHGFPKTPWEFFKRELWHGRGDFSSINAFFGSRPAVVAVANACLFAIWCIMLSFNRPRWLLASYPIVVLTLSLVISVKRSIHLRQVPGNAVLGLLYIWARFGSLVQILKRQMGARRWSTKAGQKRVD